jgi:hypothetical protein
MIFELIGGFMVALGAGGLAHLAQSLARGRLPGWIVPAAAGAGLLGYAVYMEYSWAGRTIAQLPAESTLVSRNATTAWFRPWTYVWPLTNRMTVVDHRFDRHNPAFPDLVITRVVLLGRWEPGRPVPVVIDCAAGRRADLRDTVVFGEDGAIEGADWLRLAPEDPLLGALCARTS